MTGYAAKVRHVGGNRRMRVTPQREMDVGLSGEVLRQLRMYVASGRVRDGRVPEGKEVGD